MSRERLSPDEFAALLEVRLHAAYLPTGRVVYRHPAMCYAKADQLADDYRHQCRCIGEVGAAMLQEKIPGYGALQIARQRAHTFPEHRYRRAELSRYAPQPRCGKCGHYMSDWKGPFIAAPVRVEKVSGRWKLVTRCFLVCSRECWEACGEEVRRSEIWLHERKMRRRRAKARLVQKRREAKAAWKREKRAIRQGRGDLVALRRALRTGNLDPLVSRLRESGRVLSSPK
jgi:hypothetical protein